MFVFTVTSRSFREFIVYLRSKILVIYISQGDGFRVEREDFEITDEESFGIFEHRAHLPCSVSRKRESDRGLFWRVGRSFDHAESLVSQFLDDTLDNLSFVL